MNTFRSAPVVRDLAVEVADTSVAVRLLATLSRIVILVILIAMPWFLGGRDTTVQLVAYAGILVAFAIWILAVIGQIVTCGLQTNRLPLVFSTLVACLILGEFQAWSPVVAPSAISADVEISTDSTVFRDEEERWQVDSKSLIRTLGAAGKSIAPYATRFEMAKLTFVLVTFLLGSQLFVTKMSQLWLWGLLAINGAALSFFGIVQQLSWNGKIFWTIPLKHSGTPFSSFINRNNAAGYLCVCMAAAIGIATWAFSSPLSFSASSVDFPNHPVERKKRIRLSLSALMDAIGEITSAKFFAGTVIVMIASGIVATVSRGGWLSLGIATVVTCIAASRTRGFSVFGFVLIAALFSSGLLAWSNLGDRISQRFSQLASSDAIAGDGRWNHWRDSIKAVRDFPITGTGFGTYSFANLPYQTDAKLSHLRFYHADNQFLEWLVEGGLIGIIIVFLAIALSLASVVALLKSSSTIPPDWAGYVGLFAIVSQCISASFDFGPAMPANMLAIAVVWGSVAGRATLLSNQNRGHFPRSALLSIPAIRRVVLVPALGLGLLLLGGIQLREVNAAAAVHRISRHLPKLDVLGDLDEASVTNLIDGLSKAISEYPDDAEANQSLAELLIYRFRLQTTLLERELRPEASDTEIWSQTNLAYFYRQVNIWKRTGQLERIQFLIESQSVQTNLIRAYEHLVKARTFSPLIPDVDVLLATLSFAGDPDHPASEANLRRAILIAPSSPLVFYEVGELAHLGGLDELSFACWKKSLKLSSRYLSEIHRSISDEISLDDELKLIIPESAELLIQLAQTSPFNSPQRSQLVHRAVKLLTDPTYIGAKAADRKHQLGQAYYLLGQHEEAVTAYRAALGILPLQSQWRIELTRILFEHKGPLWALREAEIGVRLEPNQRQLQELVREMQTELHIRQKSPPKRGN